MEMMTGIQYVKLSRLDNGFGQSLFQKTHPLILFPHVHTSGLSGCLSVERSVGLHKDVLDSPTFRERGGPLLAEVRTRILPTKSWVVSHACRESWAWPTQGRLSLT